MYRAISLLEVAVSFPSLVMTSAIAPFKYCYVSSMVPHGLRTQLGGSIRNRNSLPIVLLLLFSCSVVSDSLRPHELQHARPPYPSPTAGVYPSPCPLSLWCHPTISSSVALLSSCPESFPASVSWLFASGGQSIGASASASALPMNIQG